MKVMEPMSYGIEFTDKEERVITDCVTLLEEIYSIMKDHDCTQMVNTSIDEIMADVYTIGKTSEILNNLINADLME